MEVGRRAVAETAPAPTAQQARSVGRRGTLLASTRPEVPTMDRYDEAKGVNPMSPEDEIRSLDRDIPVRRDTGIPGESGLADMSRGADMSDDMTRGADISHDPTRGADVSHDVSRDAEMADDRDMPKREGDILGLGGVVVPKDANDPSTEYDDESIARRRGRSAPLDEPTADRNMSRGAGATGIDMGSGGTGTDIE